LPRFHITDNWQILDDDMALRAMAVSAVDVRKVTICEKSISLVSANNEINFDGRIDPVSVDTKKIVLTIYANKNCILSISQKYDKNWKVMIDGEPSQLVKCNFIMIGSFVPSGNHKIIFTYQPPIWGLYVQGTGIVVCLLAVIGLVYEKLKKVLVA